MTLHALEQRSEPEHPSWDDIWFVDQLAAYLRVSPQNVYAACARGDWDFALVPAGRCKRFAGPQLAAAFGVPGYAKGGGVEVRGSYAQRPGAV